MSTGNGNGFPGFGGNGFPGMAPVANVGAPQMVNNPAVQHTAGFVLDIPSDPSWEPFETTDTLEMDGFYSGRITREAPRTDGTKSAGVFLTIEINDEDARGKHLSKFMPDPRASRNNTWFLWRNLIMSITGSKDTARSGFRYQPGALSAQTVYFKTEPYMNDGDVQTSIAQFVTKQEYDDAVNNKRHRWASKPKTSAVPAGLPGGFPMASFPGLPGAPSSPTPAGAPMQQAPAIQQGSTTTTTSAGAPSMTLPTAAPASPFAGFGTAPPAPSPFAAQSVSPPPQPANVPSVLTFPPPQSHQ
jgi:hypothetical protein